MAETLQVTETELDALRINSLLNGVNLEELSSNSVEDDFEIEIIDETPKKKERTKKKDKATSVDEHKIREVPLLDKYDTLRNSVVDVTFGSHDIPYKEQLWPIPKRTVKYDVELVKSPKISADISDIMNDKSDAEREKARNGEVRYYKVTTYENVLHAVHTLAYAKITCNNNGNFRYKLFIIKNLVKDHNINYDKFSKNLESVMNSICNNNYEQKE